MTDRSLDVHADLTLVVDGEAVSIRGTGDRVVVDAPSLSVLRTLARGDGPVDPFLRRLAADDVAVEAKVGGRRVARAGPDLSPGPLSRLLGVAPARLDLGGLLAVLLTR